MGWKSPLSSFLNSMKKFLFILYLIFSVGHQQLVLAQNVNYIDSLIHSLQTSPEDTTKIKTLIEIARLYDSNTPKVAIGFAQQALELATKLNKKWLSGNNKAMF